MLKVKLEHSHGSIDRVYKTLIDNNILILNSKEFGGVTTTCLVEDRAALQNILKLLNERTYGVSLLSAKPTFKTLLRSIFK
jgi:hypothetical protein